MRSVLLIGLMAGVVAGCSVDSDTGSRTSAEDGKLIKALPLASTQAALAGRPIGAAPDKGGLIEIARTGTRKMGAATWHPVQLSEEHAFKAVVGGKMTIPLPDGRTLRMTTRRHVEHADGNWTWVGVQDGAAAGAEAIITFGQKAVFGTLPGANGKTLELATVGDKLWLVEADASQFLDPGDQALTASLAKRGRAVSAASSVQASAPASASAPATLSSTVDVVIGYTSTFASRLGGTSQAMTRLNFMVDVANQGFANTGLAGRLRLAKAVEVDYPDNTSNRSALFDLSGQNCTIRSTGEVTLPDASADCTPTTPSAALQPLLAARAQYGGDVVALVRNLEMPGSQSCGTAWMLGGGQTAIDSSDADFAFSVVNDTSGATFPSQGSTCRHETLVHEIGHNLGLQHNREVAQGSDDSNSDGVLLDPQEFGRFPYAFGYRTGSDAGSFYTIMAIRGSGLTGYRLFSNPRITACGGFACGVADVADNARALEQTMPIVASFRPSSMLSAGNWLLGDYNADGRTDIVWRNSVNGSNLLWLAGNSTTKQQLAAITDLAWSIVGIGDFDNDGRSDLVWRNSRTGANTMWRSANFDTRQTIAMETNQAWQVAGVGDFDGDGNSDLLWRNGRTGVNTIWKSANRNTRQAVAQVSNTAWQVAGVGDFDNDGKSDIFWRNDATGGNILWPAADSTRFVTSATGPDWRVAGVGDFNGDGRSDILWRHISTGSNVVWWSGSATTRNAITPVADLAWAVVGIGDFNNDGKDDVLWRNVSTGANMLWNSATTPVNLTAAGLNWIVGG